MQEGCGHVSQEISSLLPIAPMARSLIVKPYRLYRAVCEGPFLPVTLRGEHRMTKSTKTTRNLAGTLMFVAAGVVATPASASILDAWNFGSWNLTSPLTQTYFGTVSSSSSSSTTTSSSAFVTATASSSGVSVTGSTTGSGIATGTAISVVNGETTIVVSEFPQDDVPDLSAVPIPATLPLLAAGFGALGLFRRRQNAKKA